MGSSFLLIATLPLAVALLILGGMEPLSDAVVQAVWYDKSELRGARVFIGGASTGIGEQIAYEYSRLGAHVALLARREAVLQAVAEKCRALGAASAVVVAEDVSTPEAAERALRRALSSPSFDEKLDVLILNHIIGYWSWWLPQGKSNFDFLEKIFRVNVFSYVYLATLAMPRLVESSGRIVVVSSGAGKMGLPKVAPYSATKHALHGFFESLRIEIDYKKLPVSLTMAILGNIDTANNRENTKGDLQMVKRAPADDCARAIVRGAGARQRQIFYPHSQYLHAMVKLRPWAMGFVDRILMVFAL